MLTSAASPAAHARSRAPIREGRWKLARRVPEAAPAFPSRPRNPKPEEPQFHINTVNACHARLKDWQPNGATLRRRSISGIYLNRDLGSIARKDGEAVAWSRKAAEQDNVATQYNVRLMYFPVMGLRRARMRPFGYSNSPRRKEMSMLNKSCRG
jgi:hypothetical protein